MTPYWQAQLFHFVALVLLVGRLTWLAIEDLILAGPRSRLVYRLERGGHNDAAIFVQCPWCIGFWIGVATVAVLDLTNLWSFPLVVGWPFAINMVVAPVHYFLDHAIQSD